MVLETSLGMELELCYLLLEMNTLSLWSSDYVPLCYTLLIRVKYKMVAVMRKEIGKVGLVVWRAGAVPISV